MEALDNKILKAVECLAAILMAGIAVMILFQAAVPLNGPAAYMRKAPRQSTF